MRISAGANAWRKVEGLMGDDAYHVNEWKYTQLMCYAGMYVNALETMALTKKPQKIQICEKHNRES